MNYPPPPAPPWDAQTYLIQLLTDRDERGMHLLVSNYGPALYQIIATVVTEEEEARDLLQEVLMRIWTNFEQYEKRRSRLFTWMARIARNAAIDRIRSKKFRQRRKTDSLDLVVINDDRMSHTPPVEHIGLDRVVAALDDNHRAIIEYLYFREFTQAETAKALDLPLGTVKTRSRRALQLLRAQVADD